MALNHTTVSEMLFDALRKMDAEASNTTYENGVWFPTGLRYYDKHVSPYPADNLKTPHYEPEVAWARRLQTLLTNPATRITAQAQVHYPASRTTCDLVLESDVGDRFWVEIKGAWRYVRRARNAATILEPNSVFRKHLTNPTSGAAKDFLKVASLKWPQAHFVGVLVIGFDIENHPEFDIAERDIRELKANASFRESEWQQTYDSWTDEHQENDPRHGPTKGFRVRCWFWSREVPRDST